MDRPEYRYDDTQDLIEDCLAELAGRRAKWQGDALQAITLLASLVEATDRALAERVAMAHQNGHTWTEIAETLGTTPTEVRLEFEQPPS
jgi:hypothetical protein